MASRKQNSIAKSPGWNRRIDQLDGIPSQISLILEHQRLRDAEEDERELRHESFETKELYGQLGAFGAMMMVIFGAFVHLAGLASRRSAHLTEKEDQIMKKKMPEVRRRYRPCG